MAHTSALRQSTRRPPLAASVARTLVVAMVVAVFGAMVVSGAGAASSPTTASTISTATDVKLGTILTSGNTVYTLQTDKACSAKCLKAWRPVLLPAGVKKAKAGDGVDAAKLGTVATGDGARQVTYAGDALYWSSKDKSPGDVLGNATDKFGTGAVVVTKQANPGAGGTDVGTGGTAF